MNLQHNGYDPLHANRHHELIVKLKHALAECSSGDRPRMFETRDQLAELGRRIEETPWAMLTRLTKTIELMFGHVLRRGSLDVPETMQLATELLDYVNVALTLPPPPIQDSKTPNDSKPATIATESSAGTLRLKLEPAEPEEPEAPISHEPKRQQTIKRTDLDFGQVSYQMVNESRLGELLIKMGRIQPAQLDRALVLQKLSRKKLGEVLMAMEAVDLRALQAALEVQRQETLRFTDERGADRIGEPEASDDEVSAQAS